MKEKEAVETDQLLSAVKPEPVDVDEVCPPSMAVVESKEEPNEPNIVAALTHRVVELEAELEKKGRQFEEMVREKDQEIEKLGAFVDSKAATLAVGDARDLPGGAGQLQELNQQINKLKSQLDKSRLLNDSILKERLEMYDELKEKHEALQSESEQLKKQLADLQRVHANNEMLKSGLQTQLDVHKREAERARERATKEKEQRERMEKDLVDLKQKMKEAEEEKKESEISAARLKARIVQFEELLQQHHATSVQQHQSMLQHLQHLQPEPVPKKKKKVEDGAASQQQHQRNLRSQSRPPLPPPASMQQQLLQLSAAEANDCKTEGSTPDGGATSSSQRAEGPWRSRFRSPTPAPRVQQQLQQSAAEEASGKTKDTTNAAAAAAAHAAEQQRGPRPQLDATTAVVLEQTAHPTNLFAPIRLDASGVSPLAFVWLQMQAAVAAHGSDHYMKRSGRMREIRVLYCGLCDENLHRFDIFEHFVSEEHGARVRAANCGVSDAALVYWMQKLQPPRH